MSVGFRRGLFGFNCDDVVEYIEKAQSNFKKKEADLNNQVESLSKDLKESKEICAKLNVEKDIISAKLKEFTDKYEEIERLSENIGKLYLVAQANAKAIMENSQNNSVMASAEVEKNIVSIDEAHVSLTELRKNILSTTEGFVNEVDELILSLNKTKEQIANNKDAETEAKNQFDAVFDSIVNERV